MSTSIFESPHCSQNVLIVDDEEKLGRFLSMVLQQAGYTSVACQSVAEARKQLASQPWNLVITDIVMPRESGFDLMRWMKRQYPTIPVIAMTAHTTEAIENQLPKLGFSAVVYKPFPFDALRQTVQRIIPLKPVAEFAY